MCKALETLASTRKPCVQCLPELTVHISAVIVMSMTVLRLSIYLCTQECSLVLNRKENVLVDFWPQLEIFSRFKIIF